PRIGIDDSAIGRITPGRRTKPTHRAGTLAAARVLPIIPRHTNRGVDLSDRYFQHSFPNGLTLLGEKMPGVHSVARSLLLPGGSAGDPVDRSGSATVLSDLVLRGAGMRDNHALTDYLDGLGLQRSASVGVHHSRFACIGLPANVMEGLGAYSDIVR